MTLAGASRLAGYASLALTLFVTTTLIHAAATTRATMDADEAVHAIEALRRYDDLARGKLPQFLRDSYFPERWQPPVQDHLLWYPIVHSWSLLPSFVIFGVNDFAARLPSILWLAATCLIFYALARRIAPSHGEIAGMLSVFFLLAAPNVITFATQCLIETCSLFWAALSLYAYIRYVEAPDARRAAYAGAALAGALLTKYDHGLVQIACLGVIELLRHRLRVIAALRSTASLLFGLPMIVFALWLAHPDKLQAFRDAFTHPAYGSKPMIALNFAASWLLEYTSSPAVVLAIGGAFYWGLRRERDFRLRAVALYALLAMLLLAVRARFQFRYNLVEAPMALLLVAAVIPAWIDRVARAGSLAAAGPLRVWSWVLGVSGVVGAALCAALIWAPARVAALATFLIRPVFDIAAVRGGLVRTVEHYTTWFVGGMRAALSDSGWTFLATPIALMLLAAWLAMPPLRRRLNGARFLTGVAGLAFLPGAFYLHSPAELSRRVTWEYECIPALAEITDFIDRHTPVRAFLLFGGGWDQLPNNSVRWYLQSQRVPRPTFDDIKVVGDMIGSIVQPSAPRIRQWAEVLAQNKGSGLPDRIVLVDPLDGFRYRIPRSAEVAIYRDVLEARGGYHVLDAAEFAAVGCRVEILARDPIAPAPLARIPGLHRLALQREELPIAGANGLLILDDAWRHMRDPARSGARWHIAPESP
jgi:hypothetical protein